MIVFLKTPFINLSCFHRYSNPYNSWWPPPHPNLHHPCQPCHCLANHLWSPKAWHHTIQSCLIGSFQATIFWSIVRQIQTVYLYNIAKCPTHTFSIFIENKKWILLVNTLCLLHKFIDQWPLANKGDHSSVPCQY